MTTIVLNGIEIYPFCSEKELYSYVKEHKGILVATNAEKIIKASQRLREIINRNIGYCDGAGAVKALRRKGYEQTIRIPGCELWLKLIANDPTASFYLIGSTDEVISATVKKLQKTYPSLNIVGYRNGFIKNETEKQALIKEVAEKKPDYVFVAMGSPKQEYLMDELSAAHQAIYQGLGGSFDLYVGNFKRAPRVLQYLDCEWLWRFIAQPSRILRIGPYLKYAGLLYTNRL
jgi:UDP-N-acetyl-D-mannosaminouronate:lipid I N-acetyl-D-mannosaminouronosyltransferase